MSAFRVPGTLANPGRAKWTIVSGYGAIIRGKPPSVPARPRTLTTSQAIISDFGIRKSRRVVPLASPLRSPSVFSRGERLSLFSPRASPSTQRTIMILRALTVLTDGSSFLQTLRNMDFCKILNSADSARQAFHSRHYKISKRICKDIIYKSKSSLFSVVSRYRATFDNYRKYTLWLRFRDSRDEDQCVNCNLRCQ